MAKKTAKWRESLIKLLLPLGVVLAAAIATAIGININQVTVTTDGVTSTVVLSEEQVPAVIEDDKGELIQTEEAGDEEIKTVEGVDGGLFKDINTGVSVTEGTYSDLGWSETYDVSSPEAFKNDTLNKCIIANNYFGAQCVSLARVFWWSYADRDVTTCGTGMAKGMMDCAEENAGDDFLIYWADAKDQIQAGDWLVFGYGQYGHVGMALGPESNGYVALLGENQGGHSCGQGVGGSATNIVNISTKSLIGFYRPKAYVKPEPQPEPEPILDSCKVWHVKWGDTMGEIMKACRGEIAWGSAMDEYAAHWHSIGYAVYPTVLDGWMSAGGYGLFAGDTIEYRE